MWLDVPTMSVNHMVLFHVVVDSHGLEGGLDIKLPLEAMEYKIEGIPLLDLIQVLDVGCPICNG